MAEIAPFRGILYAPDRAPASEVLAPPYDVIDADERARLAALHPHNCVRLILPEAGPDGGDKYQHAAATLQTWLADGVLTRDERPALYRYHQVFTSAELGGRTVTRRGFIAAVRLHGFDEGVIMPHERTLRGPKIDRLALMGATRAHLSQIFGMYQDPAGETDRVFAEAEHRRPILDGTTADGTRHIVWRVADREVIGDITRLLAPLQIYIADGHHRYETMLALREQLREQAGGALDTASSANFATMFLANMNDPGLVVLPTHRLVHGLDDFAPEDLVAAAAPWFEVTTVPGGAQNATRLRTAIAEASTKQPSFAAVWPFSDDAALFTLKPDADRAAAGMQGPRALLELDVSILHDIVLDHLLGIDRAAQEAQTNLSYIKDTQKALDLIADCKGQVCFIMNPTRLDQVKAVSDAHEVMPQKSTFFYPKIASGVVFRSVDPDETLS
ncbi:DUF1015 domain-containing protein [Haliangium sp.]|uniref:DUF1015 domain-containing protein n=1 Tax=Haliangium sp. TaxID=2663208 RepID=UPI003D0E3B4E